MNIFESDPRACYTYLEEMSELEPPPKINKQQQILNDATDFEHLGRKCFIICVCIICNFCLWCFFD